MTGLADAPGPPDLASNASRSSTYLCRFQSLATIIQAQTISSYVNIHLYMYISRLHFTCRSLRASWSVGMVNFLPSSGFVPQPLAGRWTLWTTVCPLSKPSSVRKEWYFVLQFSLQNANSVPNCHESNNDCCNKEQSVLPSPSSQRIILSRGKDLLQLSQSRVIAFAGGRQTEEETTAEELELMG